MRTLFAAIGLALASPALAASTAPSGKLLDGRAFAVGQAPVTIVHYWASWCAPCRIEMPKLDTFYRAHLPDGVALVAITLDRGVSVSKVERAMHGMAMPTARIDQVHMVRRDIPGALPTTRVYDRAGRLIYDSREGHGNGLIDFAQLGRVVAAATR